jgi:hypothetical protein
MIENVKPVDSLTVADLQAFPVWQYTNREGADETHVRPVKRTPVTSLTGKVVGTQATLANGERIWALIGNVDSKNPRITEHFLTLSVERDGRWFTLARYHDFDVAASGPEALSQFLGLAVAEVFPIRYDIRSVAKGDEAALQGQIRKAPRERLSRAEIIAMAVP